MSVLPANTAADFDAALVVARRAKNWIFLLLLLMILFQMAAFFVARYTGPRYGLPSDEVTATVATPAAAPAGTTTTTTTTGGTPAADAPAVTAPPATQATAVARPPAWLAPVVRYVTAGINFLGVVLVLLLGVVLLMITQVLLARSLPGLASVASAFVWCALLALLLFPWQAFLQDAKFTGEFKVPGVLYTYGELSDTWSGARFVGTGLDAPTALHWARFVGWPALALVLLLIVQVKSSGGVRAALEGDVPSPDGYTIS